MLITEVYANREIFITGATGFLGKALIEKLLRDCPKVKIIYILLRAKKSSDVKQRLEELKKDKVFDRIHQECPDVLNKLQAIEGDSMELGLGIKPNELKLLENVSIIFHMAANVKFDDPLRSSILLNTRGTFELVKIAEKFKNLIAFIHCSTAFCNPFLDVVEERVYKITADWRKTIKIAETYDEYTLNALCAKYTDYFPNTYTFTKNLSEQIIEEYATKLPMLILRPSVVMNAYKEPVPGWVDNMNGIVTLLIGRSIGVLPIIYMKRHLFLDCIPVDLVAKVTIVAAYKRCIQTLRKQPLSNDLKVVNCSAAGVFYISMFTAVGKYVDEVSKNPMENCFWYYGAPWITGCYYNFLFHIIFLNIPIAFVMDNILRLMGREPLMIKTARRAVYSTKATSFFVAKHYKIKNTEMWDVVKFIPESEQEIFGIAKDAATVDFHGMLEHMVHGVKYNLFNQPLQATDGARKRFKILVAANETIKILSYTICFLYLWSTFLK